MNVHCVVVKTAIVPVVKKRRLLPEPQTIQMILDGTGDSERCAESVVCNSCYLFCKKLLQQYGDHINSSERIIDSPNVKVGYLRSQVHECRTSGDHNEGTLLKTSLFLGEEMLANHALNFPMIYQKYLPFLKKESQEALPFPRYKPLLYLGNEFGNLMSFCVHVRELVGCCTARNVIHMLCCTMLWVQLSLTIVRLLQPILFH